MENKNTLKQSRKKKEKIFGLITKTSVSPKYFKARKGLGKKRSEDQKRVNKRTHGRSKMVHLPGAIPIQLA
jgi:hypothetical protein